MAVKTPAGKKALKELRRVALGFPEVTERPSHMTPTFFVRDKKVLVHLWDGDAHKGAGVEGPVIWCAAPPGVQEELVDREPERFFRPPYVGHRGWIGMRVDLEPDWDEIRAVLEDAYRLVAPKSLIKLLDQ